jgi:hypothetical protein
MSIKATVPKSKSLSPSLMIKRRRGYVGVTKDQVPPVVIKASRTSLYPTSEGRSTTGPLVRVDAECDTTYCCLFFGSVLSFDFFMCEC